MAIDIINFALAAATIVFGGLAFCWPRYALEALSLATAGGRNDGMSEMRAASGGAFVLMGAAAIIIGPSAPIAWVMLGMQYAGAAVGRILSIFVDDAGSRKMWLFFAIEAVFALWFIAANWP